MKFGNPKWNENAASKGGVGTSKENVDLAPGHDRVEKPGRALGHDREDKNGLALGHREEMEEGDANDSPATSIDTSAGPDPVSGSGAICPTTPILFIGQDPDETIDGHCGNDELYGGRGSDLIRGGGGHDYLSGNWGDDILTGGDGADTFSFDGDFDRDTVTDFSLSDGDRLNFIFYEEHQSGWTAQMLLDLFVQTGSDAVLELPQSDEVVVLVDTEVDALSVDLVSVTNLYAPDNLLA